MSDQMVFLRGRTTVLRPLNKETDFETTLRWVNDPAVNQYLCRFMPVSRQEEEAWFESRAKASPNDIILAIETNEGEYIGTIGLHRISWVDRTATTGTMIGEPAAWGKGFGTDAKMALLQYAFERLNLRKITSRVIAFNDRSLRCQLRCGYIEEGRLPEQFYRLGRYWDEIILAATRDTWQLKWEEYQARSI